MRRHSWKASCCGRSTTARHRMRRESDSSRDSYEERRHNWYWRKYHPTKGIAVPATFQLLADAFLQRFRGVDQEGAVLSKLSNMKRGKKESLGTYVERFYNLKDRHPRHTEMQAVRWFAAGLPKDMRKHVLVQAQNDMDRATEAAQNYEESLHDRSLKKKKKAKDTSSEEESEEEESEEESDKEEDSEEEDKSSAQAHERMGDLSPSAMRWTSASMSSYVMSGTQALKEASSSAMRWTSASMSSYVMSGTQALKEASSSAMRWTSASMSSYVMSGTQALKEASSVLPLSWVRCHRYSVFPFFSRISSSSRFCTSTAFRSFCCTSSQISLSPGLTDTSSASSPAISASFLFNQASTRACLKSFNFKECYPIADYFAWMIYTTYLTSV